MRRGSGRAVLRDLRALYAGGAMGDQPDGRLLRRFVDGPAEESGAAFAALVARHGPMVLAACRRLLPGPHDAEDAFQAVFLVLARRAAHVAARGHLAGWLHEVAVRTAREARRREARRRAREVRAMASRPTDYAPEEPRDDLRAALDEELARLPARCREAIVACDLEGRPRAEAARRLGIAEGTLSSRLARGRALLRDRLARRGLAPAAPAAALATDRARAAVPEALVAAASRSALADLAGGTSAGAVPAAVASLANEVGKAMFLTKLKATLATLAALGLAATLAAGMARAVVAGGGGRDEPIAKSPAAAEPAGAPKGNDEPAPWPVARGVVVDESGRPVAGAEAVAIAYGRNRTEGRTDADGRFALEVRWRDLRGAIVVASADDGARAGYAAFPEGPDAPEAPGPLRVVLRPARVVAVRVADADGNPVADAPVEAIGSPGSLRLVRTGPDGRATLPLPAEAPVQSVFALKSGVGFDYHENTRNRRPRPAGELPDAIALSLDGARTAHVRAVGTDGEPIAGVEYYAWLIHRPGRSDAANIGASRLVYRTTGADGVATFDWLPTETVGSIPIMADAEGYRAPDRALLEPGQASGTTLVSRLVRAGTIRGRVTGPDGRPAAGVTVVAEGSGAGFDGHDRKQARTAADGSYALEVGAEAAYIVAVEADALAAPAQLGVLVRERWDVAGIDFRLGPAATIGGRVTLGPDGRPAEGQSITLVLDAGSIPDVLKREGDRIYHGVHLNRWTTTDADGRFAFRVGPGTFQLSGPARTAPRTIEAEAGGSYDIEFHMPRPTTGPIDGRVVLASDPDRGVAGALVEGVSAESFASPDFSARTDAGGRFRIERHLDRMVVFAHDADRSRAGIVAIDGDAAAVTIPIGPTASATGVALDESGTPLADRTLECGTAVHLGDDPGAPFSFRFSPAVATDADGRFTVPGMVPGREYTVALTEESGRMTTLTVIAPTEPGPIDLGRLTLGEYRSPASAEALSSFRKDAPDAGAPAPPLAATTLDGEPLSLDDFKGKYVLIDFWATWCGPCIAEIPHLTAVHEAFGGDGRFALLSLSVDESIAEPRAFQAKRRLPWAQGFVGEGVHGPVPDAFGVRAIPALVLVGPDGTIVARGMRGEAILDAVREALGGP